ncbi:MAG: phospho-N-acetylmuramoyl-pentapeptide-transferase [Patescibacteria group bacterium]
MRVDLVRVIAAFAGALIAALIVGRPYLYALRRLGLGQRIREEGPKSHQQKAGTPTMGGVIILTALCVVMLALGAVRGPLAWAFFLTLGFGLLGLADDLLGILRGRNLGLKARQKLLGQAVLAALLVLYALHAGLGRNLYVPFAAAGVNLGPVLLTILTMLAVVSAANGVNLADGLDGLAAGAVAMTLLAQTALALLSRQGEVAVFPAAAAGACLGFLWFNAHPASVFMGDTGSLALGAALSASAVLSRTTLLLPVTAGLFVLETLSVILQVISFQVFGRRIFRMSPLHHHFELGGWQEEKIVVRFWLVSLLFGAAGILAALPRVLG